MEVASEQVPSVNRALEFVRSAGTRNNSVGGQNLLIADSFATTLKQVEPQDEIFVANLARETPASKG